MDEIEDIGALLRYMATEYSVFAAKLIWRRGAHWFAPYELHEDVCAEINEKKVYYQPPADALRINSTTYLEIDPPFDITHSDEISLKLLCKYLIAQHEANHLRDNFALKAQNSLNNIMRAVVERGDSTPEINKNCLELSNTVFNYIDSTASHTAVAMLNYNELVNLESVIIKIIDVMRSVGHANIAYGIEPDVPRQIKTNEKIIQQIIINLLLASAAAQQSGDLQFRITREDTEEVNNLYVYRDSHINFCVINSYDAAADAFDINICACYALAKKINGRLYVNPLARAITLIIETPA
jgi:hypothetical protein